MTRILAIIAAVSLAWGIYASGPDASIAAEDATIDERDATAEAALPSVHEARGRADLLHETVHATLQVVHHQFYREDQGLPIPAATLKDVFDELSRSRNVELRWLAVNAQAMNVDHEPVDAFERDAVKALAAGKESIEHVEKGVYRRAATITLRSECLKCHLPNRRSTEDRAAGLVISIRVADRDGD